MADNGVVYLTNPNCTNYNCYKATQWQLVGNYASQNTTTVSLLSDEQEPQGETIAIGNEAGRHMALALAWPGTFIHTHERHASEDMTNLEATHDLS